MNLKQKKTVDKNCNDPKKMVTERMKNRRKMSQNSHITNTNNTTVHSITSKIDRLQPICHFDVFVRRCFAKN